MLHSSKDKQNKSLQYQHFIQERLSSLPKEAQESWAKMGTRILDKKDVPIKLALPYHTGFNSYTSPKALEKY